MATLRYKVRLERMKNSTKGVFVKCKEQWVGEEIYEYGRQEWHAGDVGP